VLRDQAIRDTEGNYLPGIVLGYIPVEFQPIVVDNEPPTAELITPPVAQASEKTSRFSVQYADTRSLDITSFNFGDVVVRGPNGFEQLAALHGVPNIASSTQQVVNYFLTAPGGTWDGGDNGEYSLHVVAQQVFDRAGNAVAEMELGRLVVELSQPETSPPTDMTELNADDWYSWAADATAGTSDDTVRKVLGEGSVRFTTTGGFDTLMRYQPARGVRWDLSSASTCTLRTPVRMGSRWSR
jgi:hypothetical protein